MDHFALKNGVMHAEDVPLPQIAEKVGTPVYVYSRATLERHAKVFRDALEAVPDKLIAFAVKSNPNLAVLKVLQRQGYGADVVSVGEMRRALAAGIGPEMIVFSGVGKTRRELIEALDAGIGQFNIESEEEGVELAELAAEKGVTAQCALRINPDVDAGTHDKISTGKADNKFGVPIDQAGQIFGKLAAMPGVNLRGVAVHIGSQLGDVSPLERAFEKLGRLVTSLRGAGHAITHVDLGGGLGVPYKKGEHLPPPSEYGAMVA
ncbi:MAG: diaminopimelate decarboxylase, partial [Pseudomonadota bacterium]